MKPLRVKKQFLKVEGVKKLFYRLGKKSRTITIVKGINWAFFLNKLLKIVHILSALFFLIKPMCDLLKKPIVANVIIGTVNNEQYNNTLKSLDTMCTIKRHEWRFVPSILTRHQSLMLVKMRSLNYWHNYIMIATSAGRATYVLTNNTTAVRWARGPMQMIWTEIWRPVPYV